MTWMGIAGIATRNEEYWPTSVFADIKPPGIIVKQTKFKD
jgi:hypothetical protein